MDNDKNPNFEEGGGEQSGTAPRARNRTVMLTPEVTGEVRARLAQENVPAAPGLPVGSGAEAPGQAPSGTYTPAGSGGFSVNQQKAAPNGLGIDPSQIVPQSPTSAAQPVKAGVDGVVWAKETAVVGFLVSYDSNENGDVFELRKGRLIVTSEAAAGGNFLVINDDSVSPMHAILRVASGGEVQVLDQLSEHGTRIVCAGGEEEELSGDKGVISHGDRVFFGDRKFHVCLISVDEETGV